MTGYDAWKTRSPDDDRWEEDDDIPNDKRMVDVALLDKAASYLFQAAEMLQLEASEWLSRKSQPPKYRRPEEGSWADKCGRIAETNRAAAAAMRETSTRIVETKAGGKS